MIHALEVGNKVRLTTEIHRHNPISYEMETIPAGAEGTVTKMVYSLQSNIIYVVCDFLVDDKTYGVLFQYDVNHDSSMEHMCMSDYVEAMPPYNERSVGVE